MMMMMMMMMRLSPLFSDDDVHADISIEQNVIISSKNMELTFKSNLNSRILCLFLLHVRCQSYQRLLEEQNLRSWR